MADFLVYYHSFWTPGEVLHRHLPLLTYHSNSKALYNGVNPGNSLWLVVLSSAKSDEWCLRSKFVVTEKRDRPHLSKWGRFEFIGDDKRSKTFSIDAQDDFTSVLKSLKFKTNNPITFAGRKIGNALQSPRELSDSDVARLIAYSNKFEPIRYST